MKQKLLKLLFFSILLCGVCSVGKAQEETYFDKKSGFRFSVLDESAATIAIQGKKFTDPDESYTKNIVIPETITFADKAYTVVAIGDEAFTSMQIETIQLPKTIRTIGNNNFSWMAECKKPLALPDALETIGEDCFYRNLKLPAVTIGKGVKEIGEGSFGHNPIAEYTVSAENPYFKIENDFLFKNGEDRLYLYTGTATEVNVPAKFKHLGARAFEGRFMEKVTFEEGILSFGRNLFYGCENLGDITIPSSVVEIGKGAFTSCDKMSKIIVAEGNTKFMDENGMLFNKERTILMRTPILWVNPKTREDGLNVFEVPQTVVELGSDAFSGGSFDCVVLPDNLKKIGETAFFGCSSLRTLKVPKTVESIGKMAVSFCRKLEKVYLGPGLNYIGKSCFSFSPIKEIWMNCVTPPEVEYTFLGAFDTNSEKDGVLYVPKGSKEAYKADDDYNSFDHIVESDFTSVAQVRVANLAISVSGGQLTLTLDEPQPIAIYDLTGRSIATSEATTSFSYTLPKGTYIVRCGDKVTRVVM